MGSPIDHIRKNFDLTDQQEAAVKALMTTRRYRRGETIRDQEVSKSTVYVVSGSARVYYIREGKEQTYSFAFDNEFITPAILLLNNPYSQLTIEFLEPSEVVSFPISDMRTLMSEVSRTSTAEAMIPIINGLLELSQRLEERLLLFQSATASERYAWLLNRYPQILERATITQIASFLGVTKETLYRIRAGKYKSINGKSAKHTR